MSVPSILVIDKEEGEVFPFEACTEHTMVTGKTLNDLKHGSYLIRFIKTHVTDQWYNDNFSDDNKPARLCYEYLVNRSRDGYDLISTRVNVPVEDIEKRRTIKMISVPNTIHTLTPAGAAPNSSKYHIKVELPKATHAYDMEFKYVSNDQFEVIVKPIIPATYISLHLSLPDPKTEQKKLVNAYDRAMKVINNF